MDNLMYNSNIVSLRRGNRNRPRTRKTTKTHPMRVQNIKTLTSRKPSTVTTETFSSSTRRPTTTRRFLSQQNKSTTTIIGSGDHQENIEEVKERTSSDANLIWMDGKPVWG